VHDARAIAKAVARKRRRDEPDIQPS
jgi:hypothetical protein